MMDSLHEMDGADPVQAHYLQLYTKFLLFVVVENKR
jgi:hypothetical protein